jgi:hypothetical protein
MTKIGGSGSGSISQRHGSADPDPHQNVWILNTDQNKAFLSIPGTESERRAQGYVPGLACPSREGEEAM